MPTITTEEATQQPHASPQYDPRDMAARGRIGGFSKAARYPADELTRQARRGFMARFTPTDPDLSPQERERRAQAALKAHMAKLARLSAKARAR